MFTMFMYFTEDDSETEQILTETLTVLVQQTLEHLWEWHLVGAPEVCGKNSRHIASTLRAIHARRGF